MIFIIMQTLATIAVCIVAIIQTPALLDEAKRTNDPNVLMGAIGSEGMAWAVMLSGIATIGIIALLGMIDWKNVLNGKTIDWKWGCVSILASLTGILALSILEEMMDLPNLMEDMFLDLSSSLVGIMGMAIVGPICEEFIFREGILGTMLREGMNKWVAIAASALIFGIIHLNPAQVPFAVCAGIIFGVIYCKTGNIVLTCIVHVLNNSMAVWQMYTLGEEAKNTRMVDEIGGTGLAIACIVTGLACCIILLCMFWKRHHVKFTVESLKFIDNAAR